MQHSVKLAVFESEVGTASMNKALYGLLSGVGLVVATLVAVGLLMPSAESAPSRVDASLVACAHVRVANDQGYGVRGPGVCSRLD